MNKNIKNYHELIVEENRLRAQLALRASALRAHGRSLEQELDPVLKGVGLMQKWLSFGAQHPIMQTGVEQVSAYLLNLVIKSGTKGWARWVAPIALRYFGKGLLTRQISLIVDRLFQWIKKDKPDTAEEKVSDPQNEPIS